MHLPFLFVVLFVFSVPRNTADVAIRPKFKSPTLSEDVYLALFFESPSDLGTKLTVSAARKDGADDSIAQYDGIWAIEDMHSALDGDFSLVLKSEAKHHAVSTKLRQPFTFDLPELVVQYEVRYTTNHDCGGAYVKLLSDDKNLALQKFNDKTPYTIMFGPDKCGYDTKFHFIIRYRNPKTGIYEEKHAKKVDTDLEKYFSDKKTHLYTLVIRSDNTFERYIDQVKVQSGSLHTDMEPPINPPKEIDDPNDKKPADWDDRESITDIDAKKPVDWNEDAPEFIIDEGATKPEGWLDDEPELVSDMTVERPKDWDAELDGEWEPPRIKNKNCENAPGCGKWQQPMIKNPDYKGKWVAPVIPNPAYKGVWKPGKIPNPDYFVDTDPYQNLQPISAIGLELWSMSKDVVFDNFLVAASHDTAKDFASQTWLIKSQAERLADPNARSVVDAIRDTYNEKPILVAVVGVLLTLPFLFCLWYMCRSSKPASAVHKRTDAPTPDDEPLKYDEKKSTSQSRVISGEDGDKDESEETEDDLVQVPSSGDGTMNAPKNPVSKADLESDSNDDTNETEPVQLEKQTIRKRRSRKE